MFTEPLSITIGSETVSLNRIKIQDQSATYRSSDGTTQIRVSHQESKNRVRSMFRVDKTIIAEDPLTAINASQSMGAYVVLDTPKTGFTFTQKMEFVWGLAVKLTADDHAVIDKLINGES